MGDSSDRAAQPSMPCPDQSAPEYSLQPRTPEAQPGENGSAHGQAAASGTTQPNGRPVLSYQGRGAPDNTSATQPLLSGETAPRGRGLAPNNTSVERGQEPSDAAANRTVVVTKNRDGFSEVVLKAHTGQIKRSGTASHLKLSAIQ